MLYFIRCLCALSWPARQGKWFFRLVHHFCQIHSTETWDPQTPLSILHPSKEIKMLPPLAIVYSLTQRPLPHLFSEFLQSPQKP
jgi:hypothetical protein